MEPIELTTSKGDKVYLNPKLTHGQNRECNRITASHVTLNPVTKQFRDVTADLQMFGQDKALEFLLTKFVFANGTIAENPLKAYQDLDPVDGEMILAKAKDIYNEANPPKKNETSTETTSE